MTGQEIGDTKTLTNDHILRSVIENPTFLELPETRLELDHSFPLFTLGDQMGTGEDGIVASDVETVTVDFNQKPSWQQNLDPIKVGPAPRTDGRSVKRTMERSMHPRDKKVKTNGDEDPAKSRTKNKRKRVIWDLP